MIGVIGAMDEEIKLFEEHFENKREKRIAGTRFVFGKINNKNTVIARSGVGKVNAAMCTQIMIDKFDCTTIIMCGVAGSLSKELKTGDIIIATRYIQHDLDARGLGFAAGQIPYTAHRFFEADKLLSKKAETAGKKLGLKTINGTIATGDVFVENEVLSQKIVTEFGADAIDMEAGAVAQTCHYNGVPFIVIKAVSDTADKDSAKNFEKFLHKAAENSFKIIKEIIA